MLDQSSGKFAHSPEAVLKTAWAAIEQIQKNDLSLDEYLDSLNDDPVMRRRVGSLLFNCFRHLRKLQKALLDCCSKRPAARLLDMLVLALAMAHYQDSLVPGSVVNIAVALVKKEFDNFSGKFANAVLRKALQNISVIECDELPGVLSKRWRQAFGSDTVRKLEKLFTAEPACTVRLRVPASELDMSCLQTLELDLPWQFCSCQDLGKLLQSTDFADGKYYIQDPAPAMIGKLLEKYLDKLPSQVRLLDLCAAPGGKFIMDHELLINHKFEILSAVAVDRSVKRLQLVKSNCQRCGIKAEFIAGDAADLALLENRTFELVTCDVPCSNSGVFRRRPDALHRWKISELQKIVPLQKSILNNAAVKTAPGGLLLYSTCSLEAEENQLLINDFLQDHPEFELLESKLFMPGELNDGTFGAIMRRKNWERS